MGRIDSYIEKLTGEDEEAKKEAISEISNMELANLSQSDLAKLAFLVNELLDEPNLTIKYFAKKTMKNIEKLGNFDQLVVQGSKMIKIKGSIGAIPQPSYQPPVSETISQKETIFQSQEVKVEEKTLPETEETVSKVSSAELQKGEMVAEKNSFEEEETVEPAKIEPMKIPEPTPVGNTGSLNLASDDTDDTVGKLREESVSVAEKERLVGKPKRKGKESRAEKKVVVAANATKKVDELNLFDKIINFLIYLLILTGMGYTLYERYPQFSSISAIFTDSLYIQIVLGNFMLFLLYLLYLRKFMSVVTLNKLALGSLLFITVYSYHRISTWNDLNAIYITKLKVGAAGLMNLFFPLIFLFSIFVLWGRVSGKISRYYKLFLTLLLLYGLTPFIPFLKNYTLQFNSDLTAVDYNFLRNYSFLQPYLKPLWLNINVVLPLIILLLVWRKLVFFFTFKFRKLLGTILSAIIILSGFLYGVILFENRGINTAPDKSIPDVVTIWKGIEWGAKKAKIKDKLPSIPQMVNFITGGKTATITTGAQKASNKDNKTITIKNSSSKKKTPEKNDKNTLNQLSSTPTTTISSQKTDKNKNIDSQKISPKEKCKEILQELNDAYENYTLDSDDLEGMKNLDLNKLKPYLKHPLSYYKCPAGGKYYLEDDKIKCSIHKDL